MIVHFGVGHPIKNIYTGFSIANPSAKVKFSPCLTHKLTTLIYPMTSKMNLVKKIPPTSLTQPDLGTGRKMENALISRYPSPDLRSTSPTRGEVNFDDPLLHIKNLSVFREDSPILINFDLTVKSGDWIVVRGRNGCGKSTLLKTIVGLVSPTTGDITVADYAYLGHSNGLRESMTVGQHLTFVADFLKVPLQPTPVDHLRDLYIHQLSAGLKRQLALSQFILCDRPLWIMDEPLDNLDAQAREMFLKIMNDHVKGGGAILQTSHEVMNSAAITTIELSQAFHLSP
jgi:heme exporter protein A